jgi:hypothetical protein
MSLDLIGKFPFPPGVKRTTVVDFEDTLKTMHGNENTIPLRIYVSSNATFVAQTELLPANSSDPMKFSGDNLTIPIKGTLEVVLTETKETFKIEQLEAVYLPAGFEYIYRNPGDRKVEFLMIISPPPLLETRVR